MRFMSSLRKMTVMATIKKANGNEVMISSFCTAINTSTSGLAFPKSIMANAPKRMKMDHRRRCILLGSFLPLSLNILNTKTAESTEVTKKLINKTMVVKFKKVATG